MKINIKHNYSIIIIISLISLFILYCLLSYNEYYKVCGSEEPVVEPSGECETKSDIVNFCINYKSCCGSNPESLKCICNHPVVKKCRKRFESCITDPVQINKLGKKIVRTKCFSGEKELCNNDPTKIQYYGKKAVMEKCINQNKSCCVPYNSISISSDKFESPINNNPNINKICSIQSIPNLDEKCMELCQTTPECKAFSVDKGQVVQSVGKCTLYNDINISELKTDPNTGKKKQSTTAKYYIKK